MVATMLGAIAFDPNIRGVLVVLTGVVVLMGSIFMLLSTNSGARIGILLSLAGLFGFCAILGLLWTINTGGLKGRDPAWMPAEINFNRLDAAGNRVAVATPELADLTPPEELADPEEMLERYPLLRALSLGSEGKDYRATTLTKLKTLITPWVYISTADAATLAAKTQESGADFLAQHPDVAAQLSNPDAAFRDEVQKQARSIRNDIDSMFGDWCLVAETDPRRGNAVSSADANLANEKIFGETTTAADYIVSDVWFHGGRESCSTIEERSQISRVWNRISSIFVLKQPQLISAVTLVKAKPTVTLPGQTPETPKAQDGASIMTVVQRWNYGNVRLIPFVFFIANLTFFAVCAYILHAFDRSAAAMKAAFEAGGSAPTKAGTA